MKGVPTHRCRCGNVLARRGDDGVTRVHTRSRIAALRPEGGVEVQCSECRARVVIPASAIRVDTGQGRRIVSGSSSKGS